MPPEAQHNYDVMPLGRSRQTLLLQARQLGSNVAELKSRPSRMVFPQRMQQPYKNGQLGKMVGQNPTRRKRPFKLQKNASVSWRQ